MAKFNKPTRPTLVHTTTYQGAPAVEQPLFDELVSTAATTFAGEDTFYESGKARQDRFVELVRKATDRDPERVAKFIPELRLKYLIRSASIVMAAEYAHRRQETEYPRGGPHVADVVNSALQRADEPAEFLAYWHERFGVDTLGTGRTRVSLPAGVRKGLALAVERLYDEKSVLKWDSRDGRVTMADVIELVHPLPNDDNQSALFRYLLDQRHHGDGIGTPTAQRLERVRASYMLGQIKPEERRAVLREWGSQALANAGYTWERLSGWLPGGMDAEAWEAVIPNMGVMALIRNLRNFDDAHISEQAVDTVINKITSAKDVIESKILPYRAYSAYRFAPSDNWKRALGKTLDLASANAPELNRTLFLIDTSGSMQATVSAKSKITRLELAALQALTIAKRSVGVDVVIFGFHSENLDHLVQDWRRLSVLNAVTAVEYTHGRVGHATYGHTAVARHFNPAMHDRVVMFTDDQQHDQDTLSRDVPLITFDLGGYNPKSTWGRNRVRVAGFSDQVFRAAVDLMR